MSIKQIILLIVVFFSVLLFSTLLSFIVFSSIGDSSSKSSSNDNVLKVGKYTLNYGKYVGYETDYDDSTKKVEKKEKSFILTKDKINGEKYEVNGNKLRVNQFDLYEVVGNNKISLLAGEGVDYEYEK